MGVITFTLWPLNPLEEEHSVTTVQAAGRAKEMEQKKRDFSY
jgi:hypothetical protein